MREKARAGKGLGEARVNWPAGAALSEGGSRGDAFSKRARVIETTTERLHGDAQYVRRRRSKQGSGV